MYVTVRPSAIVFSLSSPILFSALAGGAAAAFKARSHNATLNTRRIPSSLSSCSAVSTLRPSATARQPSSPIRFSAFAARSSPQLSHCALSHLTCNHYLYTSPRTRIKAHALHDGNTTIMLAPCILLHAQATYNKNAGKDGQGCRIRGLFIEDRVLELDKLFSESFLNPHYDNDRLH